MQGRDSSESCSWSADELGFHAAVDPHYVTDIHATVLHLLGLDSRQLNIPGRKRLENRLRPGHSRCAGLKVRQLVVA